MRDILKITKALADATRLRILLALREGELCACQITELLGLAPSTMSKHFYLLSHADLVLSRKEGRWVYYRRPGKEAHPAVRDALAWLDRSLSQDPAIDGDARSLRRILKCDPTDLCRKQRGS